VYFFANRANSVGVGEHEAGHGRRHGKHRKETEPWGEDAVMDDDDKQSTLVEIAASFAVVGRFLDGVIVELMVRDIETLLELHTLRVRFSHTHT